MKTFEEIVDEALKPKKVIRRNYKDSSEVINERYELSKDMLKTFFGKDIGEPVIKICKRIIDKPTRFDLLKTEVVTDIVTERYTCHFSKVVKWKVIVDKDTQQKFVKRTDYALELPSFLTQDEEILLCHVINEWYKNQKERLEEEKLRREQKRKDKFRQEMIVLYKDL